MGVIGMRLNDGDQVIGMQTEEDGEDLLIVSENGLGKRTSLDEYKVQRRGGKGLICYRITEKTGSVVAMKIISNDVHIFSEPP